MFLCEGGFAHIKEVVYDKFRKKGEENMEILTGREKIEKELKMLTEEAKWKDQSHKEMAENMLFSQWKVVLEPLKKKCDEDLVFNAKVMNPALDIKHLFKYLTKKAYELRVPGMEFVGLSDDVVIGWINDFYSEDGELMLKEEAEEAAKKAEEKAKRDAENKAKKAKNAKKAKKVARPKESEQSKPEKTEETVAEADEVLDNSVKETANPLEKTEKTDNTDNIEEQKNESEEIEFSSDDNGQLSFF